MTTNNEMTVANAIVAQLGNAALNMIGASNLCGDTDSLTFKLMRNAVGATHIRITLKDDDTYTVEFISCRGYKIATKATDEGVHADQLHAVIESRTKLSLRMPVVFNARTGARMV